MQIELDSSLEVCMTSYGSPVLVETAQVDGFKQIVEKDLSAVVNLRGSREGGLNC